MGKLTLTILFLGSLILARRNVLVGRADTRGAVRVFVTVFLLGGPAFVLLAYPHLPELGILAIYSFAVGVFWATFTASCYLALEPFVRRRHPAWLVSWNRLLEARWRDPLVGRDVMIGTLGGVVMSLIGETVGMFGKWPIGAGDMQSAAVGGWTAFAFVLRGLINGMQIGLLLMLVLGVLQNWLRSDRWGWGLWLVLNALFIDQGGLAVYWPAAVPEAIVFGVILSRSGLTGAAVAGWIFTMFNEECHTLHLSAWFANVTLATLFAVALLVAWGFSAATRGARPARPAT